MGIFSKFGKNNKGDKPKKAVKGKTAKSEKKPLFGGKKSKGKASGKKSKKKFGGKKKELTLIELMQLEESVAAASLDVVQELVSYKDGAVREIEEGLLIVAITNDMLVNVGVDPTGEEFGSFANGLRSETIESITLAKDLEDGVIGIIPSQETLEVLDEYDFIHDIGFRWAILPFGLEDDDKLIILDDVVSIDRLINLASNQAINITIQNDKVIESSEVVEDYGYTPEEEVAIDDDYSDNLDEDMVIDDDYVFDEDEFMDDPIDEDHFEDDIPLGEDDFIDDDYELDNVVDDFIGDDVIDDDYEISNEMDELQAEENKASIKRLTEHVFTNDELGLSVNVEMFDDYFDSVDIAKFDTSYQDGSELQRVISKLREDANTELGRFHQENIQSLRSKFITSLRDIQSKLVDSLDHKNPESIYGRKYADITDVHDESMDDLERIVADESESILAKYTKDRENYAETARIEALAHYDRNHKGSVDTQLNELRDVIASEIKTDKDVQIGELYKDRQTVAGRLFDKATITLLQQLQDEYQKISQKELTMYDAFRKDMDAYLRRHFADDVLRSKAEAEQLRQTHEAERVRSEYEQILIAKSRQLDDADLRAREAVRQLESSHKDQIDHIKLDFERRIEREQRDNDELRKLLQDTTSSITQIGDQKEKEVYHKLKLYEDMVDATKLELAYANERATGSQKSNVFITSAVGIIAISIGLISGFIFGVGQVQNLAPQDPPAIEKEYTMEGEDRTEYVPEVKSKKEVKVESEEIDESDSEDVNDTDDETSKIEFNNDYSEESDVNM